MKHIIAPKTLAFIALAAFAVGMVPTMQARTCSNVAAAGTWGFTTSGVFIFGPNTLVPIVNVGIFTADAKGNFVGIQTRNVAGLGVADETIKGTLTVSSNCTGTIVANAYDPSSGALIGTSTLSIVLVDNERKLQAVFVDSVNPQGGHLPGVVSADGEKMFAKDSEEGCTLATLKGRWGSALNGTIVGVGPIALVGVTKFDGEGKFSMDATRVTPPFPGNPNVVSYHITGTYTVNDNCTGTITDSVGGSSKFVIVGDRKEIIAAGTKPGSVVTFRLTKQ